MANRDNETVPCEYLLSHTPLMTHPEIPVDTHVTSLIS